MTDLCKLSLTKVATLLKNKEISALEVTNACFTTIHATEPKISALLAIDEENAIQKAKELDKEGPKVDKPLWGIPVTIKDAISTKNLETTAASRILEGFKPVYDAFVVKKLREAGAIILGKNNMDEFAMGSSTENSAYKKTKNPWNLDKVPGGSSGGSAASVSSNQCFASLGSDTGGSIRQPASFCGCVGLKPTYGRVSRYGLIAYGSSLDQIGPMTRSVADCAHVLNVIAGHDKQDGTSNPCPTDNYINAISTCNIEFLKNKKIGIPKEFFSKGLHEEVKQSCENALNLAKQSGAILVDIDLPHTDAAIATYYIIAMAEASSNLARFDGIRYGRRSENIKNLEELYIKSRSEGFGTEVKRRIMLGAYVLSSGYYDAYFKKAAQTRRIIRNEYIDALSKCDIICAPISPVTAWDLGSHATDPLQMYLMDAYTLSLNLAGLPGLAIPTGLGNISKMPIGMQLIGKDFEEANLLKFGFAFEKILPQIGQPNLL